MWNLSKLFVFGFVLFTASQSFAERYRYGYYRNGGGYAVTRQPTVYGQSENRYGSYFNGTGGYVDNRYGNGMRVETRYQIQTNQGVREGVLTEAQGADRVRIHNGDHQEAARIEAAEQERRRLQEQFVDFTRRTQAQKVRNMTAEEQYRAEEYHRTESGRRIQKINQINGEINDKNQEMMRDLNALQNRLLDSR